MVYRTDTVFALAEIGENIIAGTWGDGNDVWLRPLSEMVSSINENRSSIPSSPQLAQNDPNPFGTNTNIEFSLPEPEPVVLKVYILLA